MARLVGVAALLSQPIVVDCKGHLLGRLAASLAKELLNGQKVVGCHCHVGPESSACLRHRGASGCSCIGSCVADLVLSSVSSVMNIAISTVRCLIDDDDYRRCAYGRSPSTSPARCSATSVRVCVAVLCLRFALLRAASHDSACPSVAVVRTGASDLRACFEKHDGLGLHAHAGFSMPRYRLQ